MEGMARRVGCIRVSPDLLQPCCICPELVEMSNKLGGATRLIMLPIPQNVLASLVSDFWQKWVNFGHPLAVEWSNFIHRIRALLDEISIFSIY